MNSFGLVEVPVRHLYMDIHFMYQKTMNRVTNTKDIYYFKQKNPRVRQLQS